MQHRKKHLAEHDPLFFQCFSWDENAISVHCFFSVFFFFCSLLHWKTRKCIFHGTVKKIRWLFLVYALKTHHPSKWNFFNTFAIDFITFEWCMFFILFHMNEFFKIHYLQKSMFLDFAFLCVCVFVFNFSLSRSLGLPRLCDSLCKMRSKYTFLMLLSHLFHIYMHKRAIPFLSFRFLSAHFLSILFIES